jgi:hypothetical protein
MSKSKDRNKKQNNAPSKTVKEKKQMKRDKREQKEKKEDPFDTVREKPKKG